MSVDPHVLAVRAVRPADGSGRLFDARSADVRIVRGPHGEHLLINRGSKLVRLDVIEGTVSRGLVTLHFDLVDDGRLGFQIAALRAFYGLVSTKRPDPRFADRLLALQAVDARDAGASLRETANLLFGPGDWPGNGEYRKSRTRRLIAAGERMICAGPSAILSGN